MNVPTRSPMNRQPLGDDKDAAGSYTVATKKEWKNPALEILQRVCYGIALITGVILMNVHGIAAISIIHKVSAVLFAILLVGTEIHKAIKK